MKFLITLLFIIGQAHAYTLNNNFAASFKSNRVKVRMAGNTACDNIGMTVYELEDLISPAINNFWNRVPTSALRLKKDDRTDPIVNINDGHLCAPTDDECITSAGATVIPPVTGIVIACNEENDNFGNNSVLAVTIPNSFSGKKITGAVILINDASGNKFNTLSKSDKIGVLAHEIGHAIGLGHTEEKAALMYYRTVNQRSSLGEDDMDGVSYLYPVKLDGCGLLGGTIDTDRIDPQFWQLGIGFLMALLMNLMLKLFKRPQARASA